MKVLKINYQTYKEHQQYVIINGKVTHASYDFPVNISCTDLNNGTYLVEYDYTKYANAGKSSFNYDYTLETVKESFTISKNEKFNASYIKMRWEYIKGAINDYETFTASIVPIEKIIEELTTKDTTQNHLLLTRIYLKLEQYNVADNYINEVLKTDELFNLKELNIILGERYEYGMGIEIDLEKAYIHYLLGHSKYDLKRFFELGFGINRFPNYEELLFENYIELAYIFNILLLDTEYKKQAIEELITYAGFWDYDVDEQEDKAYTRRRMFLALTQLEAAKLIVDNNLIENNNYEKCVLFLGGYFAWKEKGHSGLIAYEYEENIGDEYDSLYVKKEATRFNVALELVEKYAKLNDDLAIKVLNFYNLNKK
ncbi:MAG: hypothetical protein IJB21_07980 [Bacilli bacterium]|nr:hypothetical protein [Bacilli bacterium]